MGHFKKSHEILLQYEDTIEKKDLEQDPTFSSYLGKIKWAVGDTVAAQKYFTSALKNEDPDAAGERSQHEIKKIMAEHK